ncbi:hypothetical protein EG328_001726 [Venturia inaequalis]|uniref:Uncharacterized protein n=1 Tax=Venturia inaequalis TaxID=5025 RepID=A0A8H3UZ01_VENIN|nr:hypothetical protein EG328_001726 [Venturia inaequalis]RDI81308.1 hypothetical protein Vi05172_g8619 [Venturia inaequalis]
MKSSSFLLVVAALVLPDLAWAKCKDAYGPSAARCECNYDGQDEHGDTIRYAFYGTRYGLWNTRWLCSCADCPEKYKDKYLRDIDSISQPMYNGRHKCRDNE